MDSKQKHIADRITLILKLIDISEQVNEYARNEFQRLVNEFQNYEKRLLLKYIDFLDRTLPSLSGIPFFYSAEDHKNKHLDYSRCFCVIGSSVFIVMLRVRITL